uniref:Putative product n=1 Tax=Xenopsylla cheopis TaxID=163159 RepID=A0A6M2DH76_XENCH
MLHHRQSFVSCNRFEITHLFRFFDLYFHIVFFQILTILFSSFFFVLNNYQIVCVFYLSASHFEVSNVLECLDESHSIEIEQNRLHAACLEQFPSSALSLVQSHLDLLFHVEVPYQCAVPLVNPHHLC